MLETKPIPEPVQHAPEPAAINMPIIMSSDFISSNEKVILQFTSHRSEQTVWVTR